MVVNIKELVTELSVFMWNDNGRFILPVYRKLCWYFNLIFHSTSLNKTWFATNQNVLKKWYETMTIISEKQNNWYKLPTVIQYKTIRMALNPFKVLIVFSFITYIWKAFIAPQLLWESERSSKEKWLDFPISEEDVLPPPPIYHSWNDKNKWRVKHSQDYD